MTLRIKHWYKENGRWHCQLTDVNDVKTLRSEWQPTNGTKGSNWLIINEGLPTELTTTFEQSKSCFDELEMINN